MAANAKFPEYREACPEQTERNHAQIRSVKDDSPVWFARPENVLAAQELLLQSVLFLYTQALHQLQNSLVSLLCEENL